MGSCQGGQVTVGTENPSIHDLIDSHGGSEVPLFCFTMAVSAALMLPSAFTSERKFVASIV